MLGLQIPAYVDWEFFTVLVNTGSCMMATTGELRAIIEELELVDAGDAASYLDKNPSYGEESPDVMASTLESCLKYISLDEWDIALF